MRSTSPCSLISNLCSVLKVFVHFVVVEEFVFIDWLIPEVTQFHQCCLSVALPLLCCVPFMRQASLLEGLEGSQWFLTHRSRGELWEKRIFSS